MSVLYHRTSMAQYSLPISVDNQKFDFEHAAIDLPVTWRDRTNHVPVLLCMARTLPTAYELYRDVQHSHVGEDAKINEISLQAAIGCAALGRLYFNLIKPAELNAAQSTRLIATALGIVEAVDNYIDSRTMPVDEKITILNSICALLCNEDGSSNTICLLGTTLAMRALDFAESLSRLPHPEQFYNEIKKLVYAVSDELKGAVSIQCSEEIGAYTMGLAPALCLSACNEIDPRHLMAARYFGASIKLIDDIADYSDDRNDGRITVATQAADYDLVRYQARARVISNVESIKSLLNEHECRLYKSLLQLGSHKWSLKILGLSPAILDK